MYARAFLTLAGVTAVGTGVPYFHLGTLDIGLPIQWFGMIVAAGVLIGATPLRRYAEWHGVSDEHIRGLLTWVMISGFLGAHEFDMIAYDWGRINEVGMNQPAGWWFLPTALWPSNWWLPFRIWDGISSYGGFIGGAIGFALFVWWKRVPVRLFADVTIVGLLPAFTIGRIGCTVVSDHVGAAVDPDAWYSFLAMDYPRTAGIEIVTDAAGKSSTRVANQTIVDLFSAHDRMHPGTAVDHLLAWNLGLIEFLYLVPVTLVILWLAFRPSRRLPAGFITVLAGALYAPVRFFLDFLRPAGTDPPHLGLTFAQWSSILAFGVALYAGSRILRTGKPAEPVTRTSREAQERLRIILREDEESQKRQAADKKVEAERKKAGVAKVREERDERDERGDAEIAAPEAAERARETDGDGDAGEADAALEAKAEAEAEVEAKPAAGGGKGGGNKPGARSGGARKQNKNRKR